MSLQSVSVCQDVGLCRAGALGLVLKLQLEASSATCCGLLPSWAPLCSLSCRCSRCCSCCCSCGCQVAEVRFSTVCASTQLRSCCKPDTAQHSTAQHSTAQHSTAQHSTAQHSTAQHSTAQHSTAQHSTAHDRDFMVQYGTAWRDGEDMKVGMVSLSMQV